MYGLLLQSAADHLKTKYGEDTWEKIRKEVNISLNGFATHTIYSETLMVDMANAASKITGDTVDTIMDSFGVEFVNFVGQFGYDRILKVLGRHMRDFLNGLDNLHEYLRFSYPKLKPPSFFVEDETKNGLTLTYRSRRRGFLHYVKGQIRQVGRVFYHTRVDIFVVANDYNNQTHTTHVKFRLLFDNKAFREVSNHVVDNIVDSIPLRPELLFELFPFHIVFSRKMEIRSVGPGLRAVLPAAVGRSLIELFNLERPLTNFTWEDILHHTNNVFQLVARAPISRAVDVIEGAEEANDWRSPDIDDRGEFSNQDSQIISILHLKGQMMYMNEWDSIMFLGTPIMSSLDDMFKIGLYINDLSMHDSSRDLVLAGTQQSAELKLALDQEQEKSRLLEQSMIKLDMEMQRTDALLYQMIPKPVADRLRKGVPSVETCQVFDNVTILFSDVVGFTTICSQITPMEVVSMLNAMYTQFDQLSERHSVYKVETIGDAYMAVSGAPTVTKYHALHMCDMALDMRGSTNTLLNPSNNETMKIRIGVHTGTTVAGVVGIKMPRYCLFGDTVNTASRMETSGEAMKIHISETTKAELEGYPYDVEERGSIEVKGKGQMKTYWLINKKEIPEEELYKYPFIAIMEEEVRNRNRDEHIENSRFKVESSQPFSTSPIPYSPVSYKDIFEDRSSPAGRKYSRASRGSADGEALRLGATMTPRGSRASLPGCPFAMGLFGASFSNESRCKSPDKNSPGKKNSVDLTISSVVNGKDSYSNSKPETSPYSAMAPACKNSQSGTISWKTSEHENDVKNGKTVTPFCPYFSSHSSSNDTVSDSIKTAQVGSLPGFPANITSCPSTSSFGSTDQRSIPDDHCRVSFASSSHANTEKGNEEKYSHRSPLNTLPSSQKNYADNDSAVGLSVQSTPVANASTGDSLLISSNTNEDRQCSETNSQSGNGTLGHKTNPILQDSCCVSPDKSMVNGTHVVKAELGCISATSFQRNKLQKKSKTCRIL